MQSSSEEESSSESDHKISLETTKSKHVKEELDTKSDSSESRTDISNNKKKQLNNSSVKGNRSDSTSSSSSDSSDSSSDNESPKTVTKSGANTVQRKKQNVKQQVSHNLNNIFANNTKVKVDDIDENMTICLLQIPKNVKPEFLSNQNISIKSKTELKVNTEKFILKPNNLKEPIALITNKFKIIQPISYLKLEYPTKSVKSPQIETSQKEIAPVPPAVKTKHPMFGVDYNRKMQLQDQIKKKMEEAANVGQEKRKRGRPRKQVDKLTDKEKEQLLLKMFETHKPKVETEIDEKKHKKHKRDSVASSTFIKEVENKPKFNLEISGINNSPSKKKNKEKLLLPEPEQPVKKKKKKIKSEEKDPLICNILNSIKEELSDTKTKGKKKHSFSESSYV